MSKNYFPLPVPTQSLPFLICENEKHFDDSFNYISPGKDKGKRNEPIQEHSRMDREVGDAINKEANLLKGKENKEKFGLKVSDHKERIGTNVKRNSELKEVGKGQISEKSLFSEVYESELSQAKKRESNELKKKQGSKDASRKCVESKKEIKYTEERSPLGDNKKGSIIITNDNQTSKKFSQIFRSKNEIKAKKVENLQKTTKECHYEESKGKDKELKKSPHNKYHHKKNETKPHHEIKKVKKDNKGSKSHKEENGKEKQIGEKAKFIYHVVIPSKNANQTCHKPNILKIEEESAKSLMKEPLKCKKAEIKILTAPSPSKFKSSNFSESSEEYPELLKLRSKLNSREEEVEREIKKFEIVLNRLEKIEEKAKKEENVFVTEVLETFDCDKSFTHVSPIMPKSAIMVDKKDSHDLPLEENDNSASIFSSTVFENSQIKEIAPNLNESYDQVYEELFKVMTSTIRPKKVLYKIQEEPEQTDEIKQMILMEKIEKEELEKARLRVKQEEVLKLNETKKKECEEKLEEKEDEPEKVVLEKSSKKEEIGDDRQEKQKLNSLFEKSHCVKEILTIGQFFPERSVSIKQEEDSRRSFIKTYTNSNILSFSYNKNECVNQSEISSSFCKPKIENQSGSDKKLEGSYDKSSNSLKVYEPRLENKSELLN